MATKIKGDLATRRSYPWEQWCDCEQWEIKRGVDYDCSTARFRLRLYLVATEKGLKVSTSIIDDSTIRFQFRKDD